MKIRSLLLTSFFIVAFMLTGCNGNQQTATPDNAQVSPGDPEIIETVSVPIPTSTLEPTPAEPMAAMINGERIWLSDFEAEIQRFMDAANNLEKEIDADQAKDIVLDTMVETILLAQGARASGFILDQETYLKKYDQLVINSGGEDLFQQWLTDNHYTQESFEHIYRLQIEAVWMRDTILSQVPVCAEQIRARQILVSSKTLAEDIYKQLQNGVDFEYYSWGYDLLSGGELGWFPRDYLILPQIEAAVFNLQPGDYTEVIESTYGYHIVQVMERELDRLLTQDALIQKQRIAIEAWLTDQKKKSTVILEQN